MGTSYASFLGDWVLTLKNLLLPIFCKKCGLRLLTEENGFFCPTCWELSPRIQRPFCTVCGKPHPGAVGFATQRNFPCADCRAEKRLPYRRIYGAAYYEDAVAEAIKLFKFNDKSRLAGPLGRLMAEFASRELECDEYDYLTPVPLHRVRRRARGYNQSELLARGLLPIFPRAQLDDSLQRIRPTRVQSRLKTEAARRANVRGAFAVANGNHLRGKCVLLIDDVITTARTVSECARALRDAKVAAVDVFAAALAVPRFSDVLHPAAP
ncbi:MAG: ComF family protein [Candidatus Hydrogenedentes bacterium]|nr:ComF family protein [Candidatus Hydrogenedentota bacterium]